jgi:hypothetical protein
VAKRQFGYLHATVIKGGALAAGELSAQLSCGFDIAIHVKLEW